MKQQDGFFLQAYFAEKYIVSQVSSGPTLPLVRSLSVQIKLTKVSSPSNSSSNALLLAMSFPAAVRVRVRDWARYIASVRCVPPAICTQALPAVCGPRECGR